METKETKEIKKFQTVIVKWRDARSFEDTYDINKVFDSCLVESVGHLKERNDTDTIIFRDLYGDDPDDLEVSGVIAIPNVWILSIAYVG